MEETLKKELREDEKLLWWGRPEEFTFLDRTYKSTFIRKLVISFGIVAALIVAYAVAAGADFKLGIAVVLLALGCIGPGNMLTDASKLRKNVTYAVTDRRLIQVLDGAKSVEYAAVGRVQLRTDSDGHTSLLCGADGEKAKETKWRELAVVGARMDAETGRCGSFVMYAVPDADKLKSILSRFVTVE